MFKIRKKFKHTSYGSNTSYEFFCKRIVTDRDDLFWKGNGYFKAKVKKQLNNKLRVRKIRPTKKRYVHLKKYNKILFFRNKNLKQFLFKFRVNKIIL